MCVCEVCVCVCEGCVCVCEGCVGRWGVNQKRDIHVIDTLSNGVQHLIYFLHIHDATVCEGGYYLKLTSLPSRCHFATQLSAGDIIATNL